MARIKGTGMLGVVKTLRADKEKARQLLPVHLHFYLTERIIASGWYPAEDFLEVLRTAAKMLPIKKEEYYEMVGRSSANQDLNGVYHEFRRDGDPLGMLKAAVLAWRSYHDTGKILVTPEGENSARVDLAGYMMACEEMCAINTAWIDEDLRLAGARDIEVAHTRCCCRDDQLCRWEVRWTPPGKR